MSTETGFSSVTFPSLRDTNQQRLEAQARARGHAAGYTEGLRAASVEMKDRLAAREAEHAATVRHGNAKVDRVVALLDAAVRVLNERSLPLLADVQGTLVAAAVDLAEAILGYELSDGENSARSALARALDQADPALVHTVRMHPADLAVLDAATRAQAGVEFAPDASLERGDALTQFPDGYLDARIETALARAKAALLGEDQ